MAGNVDLEFTGDEKRLVRALGRSEREIDKLKTKLKQTAAEGKKTGKTMEEVGRKTATAGKKGKEAFGAGAVTSLKGYAAALGGVTAAVGVLSQAMTAMKEIGTEAGQRITDAMSGRRALAQIAKNKDEYNLLLKAATSLRTDRGLDAATAYRTTFSASSAGQLKNLDLFGQLPEIAFDSEAGIEAVQKLQANFGGTGAGRTGGGTARQIINKTLAAAGPSPLEAPKFARAASIAATAWSNIGGQDEGLLAALSAMAGPMKTPEAAAERIKSLAGQLNKKRGLIDLKGGFENLQGLDLAYALPQLAKEKRLTSEKGEAVDVTKFLGEMNAVEGFTQLMKQQKKIRRELKTIVSAEELTGGEADLLAGRLGLVRGDKPARAVKGAKRSEQDRQVKEEQTYGTTAILADELNKAMKSEYRLKHGPVMSYLHDKAIGINQALLGNRGFLNAFGDMAPTAGLGHEVAVHQRDLKLGEGAVGPDVDAIAAAVRQGIRDGMRESRGPALGGPNDDPKGN